MKEMLQKSQTLNQKFAAIGQEKFAVSVVSFSFGCQTNKKFDTFSLLSVKPK